MARVTDVVCGMTVDSDNAAAQSDYDGRTYYFCSPGCKDQFDAAPESYATKGGSTSDREVPLEKHEKPFTKAGGMFAPKFGSSTSGGAEFDPGPERHVDGKSGS